MRSGSVVITSPFLDCATRMEDRWECMFVEEFVAESTVEALDTAVARFTGATASSRKSPISGRNRLASERSPTVDRGIT